MDLDLLFRLAPHPMTNLTTSKNAFLYSTITDSLEITSMTPFVRDAVYLLQSYSGTVVQWYSVPVTVVQWYAHHLTLEASALF